MLGNSLCRLYNDKHEIHSFHRDKKCYTICKSSYCLDLKNFHQIKTYFNKIKPDLIIVMGYGLLLPKKFLSLPKFGCINIHVSLLPKYRGAAPIQRAILNGDNQW